MTQANAHSESGHAEHDEHGDEPHVLPLSIYFGVWGALVVLTAITVFVSRFDFGTANTFVALLVATIKGSLVALYFMHLRYDNKLNLIILVSSLLFVSIFFTPTLIDLSTRDALDVTKGRMFYRMQNTPPVPMPVTPAPAAPATPDQHGAAPAAPAAPATPDQHGAAPAAPATPDQHGAAPAAPAQHPVAPAAPAAPTQHPVAPAGHGTPSAPIAPTPAGAAASPAQQGAAPAPH